jgi:hypothetical protein
MCSVAIGHDLLHSLLRIQYAGCVTILSYLMDLFTDLCVLCASRIARFASHVLIDVHLILPLAARAVTRYPGLRTRTASYRIVDAASSRVDKQVYNKRLIFERSWQSMQISADASCCQAHLSLPIHVAHASERFPLHGQPPKTSTSSQLYISWPSKCRSSGLWGATGQQGCTK